LVLFSSAPWSATFFWNQQEVVFTKSLWAIFVLKQSTIATLLKLTSFLTDWLTMTPCKLKVLQYVSPTPGDSSASLQMHPAANCSPKAAYLSFISDNANHKGKRNRELLSNTQYFWIFFRDNNNDTFPLGQGNYDRHKKKRQDTLLDHSNVESLATATLCTQPQDYYSIISLFPQTWCFGYTEFATATMCHTMVKFCLVTSCFILKSNSPLVSGHLPFPHVSPVWLSSWLFPPVPHYPMCLNSLRLPLSCARVSNPVDHTSHIPRPRPS